MSDAPTFPNHRALEVIAEMEREGLVVPPNVKEAARHLAELTAHQRYVGDEGCLCAHRYGSYGRLHGVDMGKGWIRTSTHPDCPHHGTNAQEVKRGPC